jgi:hypothetical protein
VDKKTILEFYLLAFESSTLTNNKQGAKKGRPIFLVLTSNQIQLKQNKKLLE